jgi:hypothetical protein
MASEGGLDPQVKRFVTEGARVSGKAAWLRRSGK